MFQKITKALQQKQFKYWNFAAVHTTHTFTHTRTVCDNSENMLKNVLVGHWMLVNSRLLSHFDFHCTLCFYSLNVFLFSLIIPNQLTVEKEKYFLFGILCGLAFNNCSVVNLPFPLALFKKLLNIKPSLEDLAEFDPGLGR